MTLSETEDVTRKLGALGPLLAAGKADEAIAMLRDCLLDDPQNPMLLIQLGELLRHTRDIVEGVALLRQGLATQPANVIGWLSLGSALRNLAQPDGAQAAFRTVLDLDPKRIEALNDLGTIMMDRKDWAEAVELFRRASDLAPGVAGIRMNLARALAQDGRSEEALKIAEDVASSHPGADAGASQLIAELKRPVTMAELTHSLAGQRYNLKATDNLDRTFIEPELERD